MGRWAYSVFGVHPPPSVCPLFITAQSLRPWPLACQHGARVTAVDWSADGDTADGDTRPK